MFRKFYPDSYYDSTYKINFQKEYDNGIRGLIFDIDNTVFVGDQLFTDVFGARRTGIKSYLVKPIGKKEEIQIVLKRYLEKIVLFFYNKKVKKDNN